MKCKHSYTRNVLSGNDTHYAKAICTSCNVFTSWKPKGSPISELLMVPFDDKDEAKSLGARWDSYVKCWYCPSEQIIDRFEKWRSPNHE